MKTTIEDLENAKDNYENIEYQYLISCGWKYTCHTPGSYWLWEITWEGKTILVEQSMAVDMQKSMILII